MFTHILYTTDFSKPSKLAARAARAMALAFKAEVTLLHVVDMDDSDDVRNNAQTLLADLQSALFEGVDKVNVRVAEHDRADVAICEEARSSGADLIVAGRHGQHTMAERLVGSTTERVARHAECSVLVAQDDDVDPYVFAQRVLACSDMSSESVRAVEEAGELAKRFDGTLTLAHVYTVDVPPFAYAGPSEVRKNEGMERHAKDALAKLAKDKLADQEVTLEVREHASAVAGICDIAEETAADLVAVGTRGRTGLARLLIGSVAERIVRHAPCAVLVARP